MKTFKSNATKVAQEQLNYFIKTDLGNYAKLRNYDYGPTNRGNVSNLSKFISHRVIDEYYVIKEVLKGNSLNKAENIYTRDILENLLERLARTSFKSME